MQILVRNIGFVVFACGVGVGCGSDVVDGAGTESDAAETETSGGSASGSTSPGTTSNAGPATATSETTTPSDLPTETGSDSTDGQPVECQESSCATSCSGTSVFEAGNGTICECDSAPPPEGYLSCEFDEPCGFDVVCMLQAIRYGVPGHYEFDGFEGKDALHVNVDVLGPDRLRAIASGWTHDCCGGVSVNEFSTYHHPQATRASDDPYWTDCIEEWAPQAWDSYPACLLPEALVTGSSCEPMLQECPELPDWPGQSATCEEACPMADDGICDEPGGTGLCPADCDPIDCTCAEDMPGQCDEVSQSGVCPLGSDPDC